MADYSDHRLPTGWWMEERKLRTKRADKAEKRLKAAAQSEPMDEIVAPRSEAEWVPEEPEAIDCANRPDLIIICHDTFCPHPAAQVMTIQVGDHKFAIPVCQFHLDEVERQLDFPAS